jgi:hypothetical protein
VVQCGPDVVQRSPRWSRGHSNGLSYWSEGGHGGEEYHRLSQEKLTAMPLAGGANEVAFLRPPPGDPFGSTSGGKCRLRISGLA